MIIIVLATSLFCVSSFLTLPFFSLPLFRSLFLFFLTLFSFISLSFPYPIHHYVLFSYTLKTTFEVILSSFILSFHLMQNNQFPEKFCTLPLHGQNFFVRVLQSSSAPCSNLVRVMSGKAAKGKIAQKSSFSPGKTTISLRGDTKQRRQLFRASSTVHLYTKKSHRLMEYLFILFCKKALFAEHLDGVRCLSLVRQRTEPALCHLGTWQFRHHSRQC